MVGLTNSLIFQQITLIHAVGGVAFPALSQLQDDPNRFKRYFLKGYSLVLALTVPITIVCALFADDLIFVLLGPKWTECGRHFSLAGSDDLDLCDDQSSSDGCCSRSDWSDEA